MKKMSAVLLPLLFGSALLAQSQDTTVQWKRIVGEITAPNVDNPVAGISAGTLPWVTTAGNAHVNLSQATVAFDVDGLVLDGGSSSGTVGSINRVVGTLVCNAGTRNQVLVDTPAVPLSSRGDADFAGHVDGVPSACDNPLFLIRIPQFGKRWIATGAVRTIRSAGY
jgi:hypothetical protein